VDWNYDSACCHCGGTTRLQKEAAANFHIIHVVSSLLINGVQTAQYLCHEKCRTKSTCYKISTNGMGEFGNILEQKRLRFRNVWRQSMKRRSCLQLLAASGFAGMRTAHSAIEIKLRIGLTPVILADQVAFLSRWGRYLSERAGCEVTFIARESYQSILDLLMSDQLDAAWICGYPFVRHEAQLSLLCVPLYLGQPTYQAYLIRTQGVSNGINGWEDLKDKVLAYSDPLSNSGWLVAQAQMAKAGLNPRELKRTFFAHGHRNVAQAVASRLAHAGSIDGYVWETMRQQGMTAIAKTEVVWKSEQFGFPPLVTLRGAGQPALARLQQAMIAMAEDKSGQELLRSLNLTGFTQGQPSMFDSIRRQARTVPGSGVAT
jgi:phosphonate transport system substrate-binding protein